MRILSCTSTQNLLESLKNLGYLSFSATAPYFQNIKIYNLCSHYSCSICNHIAYTNLSETDLEVGVKVEVGGQIYIDPSCSLWLQL